MEDPQGTAVAALLAGDLRLLSDILAEESFSLELEAELPGHGHKTLLQLAVEAASPEAARLLVAGGARLGHTNSVLKVTALHVAAGRGEAGVLAALLRAAGTQAGPALNLKDRAGVEQRPAS